MLIRMFVASFCFIKTYIRNLDKTDIDVMYYMSQLDIIRICNLQLGTCHLININLIYSTLCDRLL